MAVATCTICVLVSVLCCGTRAEKVLGVETDEFDFDGLPGARHEFKVEIAPGRDECFYQRIVDGGHLYVSYEVLRGGDGEVSLSLQNPEDYSVIQMYAMANSGGLKYQSNATKTYAICFYNNYAIMGTKLVYLYLMSYTEDEWSKYRQEIEDVDLTFGNFSTSVDLVQESLTAALVKQAEGRMHVMRDWYLVIGNNWYIKHWSIVQCVVIVCSSCFQVYFVRRLFRNVNVVPKRPRA